jgi:universal stress protein A
MAKIKHILIVTRSTHYCKAAVDYGLSLAKENQAKATVIHSIYNPFHLKGINMALTSLPMLEDEYTRMQEEARNDLDRMIEKEKSEGLEVEVVIGHGEPDEDILNMVRERGIDLLVLRAHEEGVVEHLIYGRENEKLIRKMPCSILLVKDEPGAPIS